MHNRYLRPSFVIACAIFTSFVATNAYAEKSEESAWSQVVRGVNSFDAALRAKLKKVRALEGAPARVGRLTVFRYNAPAGTQRVYLAGSFNNWAANQRGQVTSSKYLMANRSGLWSFATVVHGRAAYKFVIEDSGGQQTWRADPNIQERDTDGNSVLNTSASGKGTAIAARDTTDPASLSITTDRAWYSPGQRVTIQITTDDKIKSAKLSVTVEDPLGNKVSLTQAKLTNGVGTIAVKAPGAIGGYRISAEVALANKESDQAETTLTVADDIAQDLRYGFFATYPVAKADDQRKAAMLRDLHLNAIEFYDYFPAHGKYAPVSGVYRSDPFGITINGNAVISRIAALRGYGILPIAYVAAYAASQSVYDLYPDPMTDERGVRKVFNGAIMTEDQADLMKKDKWFTLMNIGADSYWSTYILDEFARAAQSFDGFELDTYGDNEDTAFYANKSGYWGAPLRQILRDFVGRVRSRVNQANPNALISFNSVNEFAANEMSPLTDFSFFEIWRGYCDSLEGLTDICFDRRGERGQRSILKLYPSDMAQPKSSWPAGVLERVLGATMVGAGSLMVAGEPDESTGKMHGLNTLYYPDHQALSAGSEQVLRDYYAHDALLFGINHGAEIKNTELESTVPGGYARTYLNDNLKALVTNYLLAGGQPSWSGPATTSSGKQVQIVLPMPARKRPKLVLLVQPGSLTPTVLKFKTGIAKIFVNVPTKRPFGTIVQRY